MLQYLSLLGVTYSVVRNHRRVMRAFAAGPVTNKMAQAQVVISLVSEWDLCGRARGLCGLYEDLADPGREVGGGRGTAADATRRL